MKGGLIMNLFLRERRLYLCMSVMFSLILLTCQPVNIHAQSSPFPEGYINYNDTISYNYGNLNYLIITADSLRPAFRDFAMSKALKGYEVKIAAVEDIYQTYSSVTDSVERIKWYIANEYISCEKQLQYVLLGGDVNIVPTRFAAPRFDDSWGRMRIYVEDVYLLNKPTKFIASDIYYTSFNGSFDWDAGQSGYYAEIAEHVLWGMPYNRTIDIVYDEAVPKQYINISRLPVQNSSDIINYTRKLFRYERGELMYPISYSRALFAGDKAKYYMGSISDGHYWGDSISSNYLTDMTIDKLYDSNYTASELNAKLSDQYGHNLINIASHGYETGWRMHDDDTDSLYNVLMAENLTASAASIITTTACDIADFTTQSIGNTFILNPNNNTIAFWGATSSGFTPTSADAGPSLHLIGDFYRNLQNEPNKQIGHIIEKSKREMQFAVDSYNYNRYLALAQTLLGDAEFSIYNSSPNYIKPFDLFINGRYALMGSFDTDAHYNLMFDCEENPSEATHDADYTHLYPVTEFNSDDFLYEGPFQIGITKPGYAPWRSDMDYYATVTIQGTELDGEHLRAQNYVIGSAIDTDYDTGLNSVAVGSNVTLEVGNSLTITDSFTCPVGATLEIKPMSSATMPFYPDITPDSVPDGIYTPPSLVDTTADKHSSMDESIYNLQGQKLNALQHGINIVGGKKVIVK